MPSPFRHCFLLLLMLLPLVGVHAGAGVYARESVELLAVVEAFAEVLVAGVDDDRQGGVVLFLEDIQGHSSLQGDDCSRRAIFLRGPPNAEVFDSSATKVWNKHRAKNKILGAFPEREFIEMSEDFFRDPELVKGWVKFVSVPGTVSSTLRKQINVLSFISRHGDNIPQSVVNDLAGSLDKPIKETIEHIDGKKLSFVLDRPGRSNQVVSVHPTSSGQFKRTVYDPAYNPDLNPSIPVPRSQNGLVPDFMGTQYMHPLQGSTAVRIKLSGNRNADFSAARFELGITQADETVNGVNHTWHHMDDFEIINGEAYSTMQLVKSSAHQGTGVRGMQHSGAAAQWKAFFGSGY